MRLQIVLVAVICLFAAEGSADTEYGIKVGACFARQTYSYASYAAPGAPVGVTLEHEREGATAGVFGHWRSSSGIGLMAEVQYTQKGIVGADGEHVDSVSFPLLPRYDVRIWRGHMYVAAGPRLDAYLLPDEPTGHPDAVEFGGDVVLGYQLGRFSVEGRYSGRREPFPVAGAAVSSGDVLHVLVGWTFWREGEPHERGASDPTNYRMQPTSLGVTASARGSLRSSTPCATLDARGLHAVR